jgi:hypothetical protein
MSRHAIILIAFALAAATAHAQGIFRSTMPDGRIIYGDKPAPGAKESKEVTVQPNIAVPPPQPAAPAPSPQQKDFDKADADVKKAQQELDRARAALAGGTEPQEGERIGTKSGASRLNDAYAARIKSLEDAVVTAQARLDDALARRNAAR